MNLGIFVYDISLTGGAEHVAINLGETFASYHNVYMISLFEAEPQKVNRNLGYKNITLSDRTGSIPLNFLKYTSKLKKQLKENNIDILLTITAGVITLANAAAIGTKTKVIYAEHSNLENKTYGKKHEFRQFIGAKFSDYTVTLTERDKNNFIKTFNVPTNKICTIPNWYINNNNSDTPYNPDTKKIVSVGRLESVKGYNYLLEVAKILSQKHGDWHWDICGDGTLRQELEASIKALGLSDFITLKGNVNNVADILKNYSLFVMTSKYEGLPMSLLEAQSASLPIVSFDCPTGPGEIISDGINGYTVPTYETETMANKLDELICNRQLRVNFSNNAQIDIARFSKSRVLNMWLELFDFI